MQPTYASSLLKSGFRYETRRRSQPLVDFERGGAGLSDPSQGLDYQTWTSTYDGSAILVGPVGEAATPILTIPGVVRTALAFDLAMRPHLGYTVGTTSYLYWYDSQTATMATMELPAIADICMTLDYRSIAYSAQADIIVTYSRNKRVYTRIQRERFQIEHMLQDADMPGNKISRFGMLDINRLAWTFSPN